MACAQEPRSARLILGALAAAFMALAMPAQAGAALSFEAHRTWPVGAQPRGSAWGTSAPADSAGAPDVITANFDVNNLTVFDGPFYQNCSTLPPPRSPTPSAAGRSGC